MLDVFQGRQRTDLVAWFAEQRTDWVSGVSVVVADLHEPFRATFDECVPDAVQVADPMHVVMARTGARTRPAAAFRTMGSSRLVTSTGNCTKRGKRKRTSVTSTHCGANRNSPRCGLTRSSKTPVLHRSPKSKVSVEH